MIKKVIITTMVLLFIGGFSAVAHANPSATRATNLVNSSEVKPQEQALEESLRLITPSRDMVVTDTNLVLAFIAPEGTTVTIDVYYNTSVATSRQNYVKAYDPIEIKVGALQRGWAEVELRKGLNKIDFTAVYKNGLQDVISRVIEVKDITEVKMQVERSIATTSSTETLRSIVVPDGK